MHVTQVDSRDFYANVAVVNDNAVTSGAWTEVPVLSRGKRNPPLCNYWWRLGQRSLRPVKTETVAAADAASAPRKRHAQCQHLHCLANIGCRMSLSALLSFILLLKLPVRFPVFLRCRSPFVHQSPQPPPPPPPPTPPHVSLLLLLLLTRMLFS